jgi:hypothetical protein
MIEPRTKCKNNTRTGEWTSRSYYSFLFNFVSLFERKKQICFFSSPLCRDEGRWDQWRAPGHTLHRDSVGDFLFLFSLPSFSFLMVDGGMFNKTKLKWEECGFVVFDKQIGNYFVRGFCTGWERMRARVCGIRSKNYIFIGSANWHDRPDRDQLNWSFATRAIDSFEIIRSVFEHNKNAFQF